jgi:RNA polymerase-binding transcription factor DksA
MNLSDIKNNEERLIILKRGILHRLNLLDQDIKRISNPLPESLDEQGAAIQNDEVVNRLDIRDSVELQSINDALKRIELKVFGKCTSCGNEISKKRLRAMPYAANCIECENGNDL